VQTIFALDEKQLMFQNKCLTNICFVCIINHNYHQKGVPLVDVFEKLKILTDAAKYDVACTSSGVNKKAKALAAPAPPVSATVFRPMDAAFLC